MPSAIAKNLQTQYSENRELDIVQINYNIISDSLINPTESDYKTWYNEHKYYFKQEPSAEIEYVIFDVNPTIEDMLDIDIKVTELYEEFTKAESAEAFINTLQDSRYDSTFYAQDKLGAGFDTLVFSKNAGDYIEPFMTENYYEFAKILKFENRPDSIKASHLLIQYNGARGSQATRTKEEAKAIVDSLFMAIKANKANFEEAVLAISEYQTAKRDTGNLGWMEDGNLNYQYFYDSLMNTVVGNYKVLESALGYHLLKVTDRTAPIKKVQLAIGRIAIEPSENTIKDIYTLANELSCESENIDTFNKIIIDKGYNKRLGERIDKMQYTIPGVENGREIIRWCFDSKTKAGQVSQVYDIDNKYIVVALKNVKTDEYAKLEDVKTQIEALVKRDLKAKQIISENETIASLDAVAQKYNTEVSQLAVNFRTYNLGNMGPESSVVGSICAAQKGNVSKAIKGEMGVYVYKINEITPGNEQVFEMIKQQQESRYAQQIPNMILEVLKDKTDITDNRNLFY